MSSNQFNKNTTWKFNIVVFIAIVISVLGATTLHLQNDTYYSIKLGERLLNEGMIPIDNFTWHEGIVYSYPHWLYNIFIYAMYHIGGYFGVYFSTVILGCILGFTIYFTYLNLYKNPFVTFLMTVALMSMLAVGFTARAQSVTYIIFVLQIFFIEKLLQKGELKYCIFLIILSILIVNIHTATWVLFFILCLPYLAEYIIACFIKLDTTNLGYKADKLTLTKNDHTKKLFVVFFICLFTGLISPIGDTPYTYLYKTYQSISPTYVIEHFPIVPIENVHFLCFVGSVWALLVFTKVKMRVTDLFMLGGLLLMTLMSLRQSTILFIVGGFFLCRIATEFFVNNNKDRVDFYFNKIATAKGGVIALLFISLLTLDKAINLPKEYDSEYPVKATEFMLQNLDIENIKPYTHYNIASYLLFNNIKVFIDSRSDLYTIQFNKKADIFVDYINLAQVRENYKEILEKYQFTHFLLLKNESLDLLFKDDPQHYNLIYSDDEFVLYEVVK